MVRTIGVTTKIYQTFYVYVFCMGCYVWVDGWTHKVYIRLSKNEYEYKNCSIWHDSKNHFDVASVSWILHISHKHFGESIGAGARYKWSWRVERYVENTFVEFLPMRCYFLNTSLVVHIPQSYTAIVTCTIINTELETSCSLKCILIVFFLTDTVTTS